MKNKNGEIDIELDLFPCNKCNDWHPALRWHDKYDDYLRNRQERWAKLKKERPTLFQEAKYHDILPALNLIESEYPNKCYICGCATSFISRDTRHPVCSEECRYRDTKSKNCCL